MSKPTSTEQQQEQDVAYGYPVYTQNPAAGYGPLPQEPAYPSVPPYGGYDQQQQQQQLQPQQQDVRRRYRPSSITDMPRRITPCTLLNPFRLVHLIVATAALPFKSNKNKPAPDGHYVVAAPPALMEEGCRGRHRCCGRRASRRAARGRWCSSAAWQPKGLPPLQQQQPQHAVQAWQPAAAPSKVA